MSGGNASFRGLLDAGREQAAGVFAALEDAGVWVDSAAQGAGKPPPPTAHRRWLMCTRALRMVSQRVLVSLPRALRSSSEL